MDEMSSTVALKQGDIVASKLGYRPRPENLNSILTADAADVGNCELTHKRIDAMVHSNRNLTNIAIATLMLGLAAWASFQVLHKPNDRQVVGVVEVGEIQ